MYADPKTNSLTVRGKVPEAAQGPGVVSDTRDCPSSAIIVHMTLTSVSLSERGIVAVPYRAFLLSFVVVVIENNFFVNPHPG